MAAVSSSHRVTDYIADEVEDLTKKIENTFNTGDVLSKKLTKCGPQVHEYWTSSISFMETAYGRDRSLRFFQYLGRCLSGVTHFPVFQSLSSTMALSRKGLRFFGPIKAAKALCDLYDDKNVPTLEKNLTLTAILSDAIYRLFDHVAFMERIKLLKLTPERSDLLDRFIEIFWLTEVIPMIFREAFAYFNLRMDQEKMKEAGTSVSDLFHELAERKKKVAISLFKVLFCDLPCIIFVLNGRDFKTNRKNKVWCGFLGAIASLIGCYQNWPESRRMAFKRTRSQLSVGELKSK